MRKLMLVSLGGIIWGLTLIWPEVNRVLTPQVSTVLIWLGLSWLVYRRFRAPLRRLLRRGRGPGSPDTRPMQPLGAA